MNCNNGNDSNEAYLLRFANNYYDGTADEVRGFDWTTFFGAQIIIIIFGLVFIGWFLCMGKMRKAIREAIKEDELRI